MALDPNSLTDAIDDAFVAQWAAVKKTPLADAGKEDRRLLFAAVAHGLLQYLSSHQSEFIAQITLTPSGTSAGVTYDASGTTLGIQNG